MYTCNNNLPKLLQNQWHRFNHKHTSHVMSNASGSMVSPFSFSVNTTSALTGHHAPSAVNSQPTVQAGSAVMSQYPPLLKPAFSVFGDRVSEPLTTDSRMPPRKNEDR